MFFFSTQEVELGQVADLLPLHAPLEGEVEIVQGLHLGEAGRPHPVLTTVSLPGRHLLGEDRGQIALIVPALLPGPFGQKRGRLADARGL